MGILEKSTFHNLLWYEHISESVVTEVRDKCRILAKCPLTLLWSHICDIISRRWLFRGCSKTFLFTFGRILFWGLVECVFFKGNFINQDSKTYQIKRTVKAIFKITVIPRLAKPFLLQSKVTDLWKIYSSFYSQKFSKSKASLKGNDCIILSTQIRTSF